jgi:PAS domain-containing protein
MTNNFAGLYSSSGFDMLGVLARVAARPNPQLQIGAVDTSCAFLVVDARKWDQPIVFASETFTKMTGYKSEDIIGRNCKVACFESLRQSTLLTSVHLIGRFLQSPDGITQQGAARKYTDSNAAVSRMSPNLDERLNNNLCILSGICALISLLVRNRNPL